MRTYFRLLLLLVTTLSLTGCFETTEEITVNDNGSGTYHLTLDMSGIFSMMDMMKSDDDASDNMAKAFKREMDTSFNLGAYTDTATKLTPEQKSLMHNATMSMTMSSAQKKMVMGMNFPFQKIGDVEKIMELSKSGTTGKIMGGMVMPQEAIQDDNNGMADATNFFDLTFQPHLIERKINQEKYKAAMESESLNGFKSNTDMMSSIKMNTVIHLPRAAKKVEGAGAKLTADKKTITINGSLSDLMETPENFAYRIEY